MISTGPAYPLRVHIGYPEARARWSAAARLPMALPAVVFSCLLNIGATLAIWAAILVSGRIPSWLLGFQVNVNRWHTRAASFSLLLSDHYPVFEGEHPVAYELDGPAGVSRLKVVVWKLITAIPQLVVLAVLTVGLVPVTMIAWFALVLTGQHPRPLHRYAAGVVSWYARLAAYLQSLTDDLPAFSLKAGAGRSGGRVYRTSAVIGLIPVCAVAGFTIFILGFTGTHVTNDVSYQALQSGTTASSATVESGEMRLVLVTDAADQDLALFHAESDARYVAFTISIRNRRSAGETVPVAASSFRLEDAAGRLIDPILVGVDGVPGPGAIPTGGTGRGLVVFEVRGDQPPKRLVWNVVDYISVPRRGETIEWVFT